MLIDLPRIRAWAAHIAGECEDGTADAAYLDTLDGETGALDLMDAVLAGIAGDDATVAAIKAQEDRLALRRRRIEGRADRGRAVALDLLDALGLTKLERPAATVSRRAPTARVEITEEAEVPSQLCRVKREPDKAAIKALLACGEGVPGARLVSGAPGVTLRWT